MKTKWMSLMIILMLAAQVDARDSLGVSKLATALRSMGIVNTVALQEQKLYLGCIDEGLQIVDVSNPLVPRLLGAFEVPGEVWIVRAEVMGNYAFVLADSGGLRVVDVSDPMNPVEVARCETGRSACEMDLAGDNIFIANRRDGLLIVDISDPLQPGRVGTLGFEASAATVGVRDDVAYVTGHNFFASVDVSDPARPRLLAQIDAPLIQTSYETAFYDDYVFISAYSAGLLGFDISDPAHPELALRYGGGEDMNLVGVTVAGDRAFLSTATGEIGVFKVLDISDPANLNCIGYYYPPLSAVGCAVDDSLVYIAGYGAGLRIARLEDNRRPVEISFCSREYLVDVAVVNNIVYACLDTLGVASCDIGDPRRPFPLGTLATSYEAEVLAVKENLVCVGGRRRSEHRFGIIFIDALEPDRMFEFGVFDLTRNPVKLIFNNDNLIAATQDQLLILDVFNPAHPVELGRIERLAGCLNMTYADGVAYLAQQGNYLRAYSVADPRNISQIGEMRLGSEIYSMAALGTMIYAACEESPIRIIEAGDPLNMWECGRVAGASAYALTIADGCLYAAMMDSSLRLFSLADPFHPEEIGFYREEGVSYLLCAEGDLLLGLRSNLLTLYDCSEALTASPGVSLLPGLNLLAPCFPNPFNSSTSIWINLNRPTRVEMAVFDPVGRRIADILPGDYLTAGRRKIEWNAGNSPSGVYIIRLQSEDSSAEIPAVLSR